MGPKGKSLKAGSEEAHTPRTNDATQLWTPNWGGGGWGGCVTDRGCWKSLTVAITGLQRNTWPLGHRELLPAWMGRHSLTEEVH